MAADFFRAAVKPDGQGSCMTKGAWLMAYGVLLFFCGVAAYLVNPAFPLLLISGALAGGLMAGLGVIFLKGGSWVLTVATMLTLVFMMFGLALAMNYGLKVIKESTGLAETMVSVAIFAVSGLALWALKKKA